MKPVYYVHIAVFLLRIYRYISLCFYYVATETYCGGSEFKYPAFVPKLMFYRVGNMPYTKNNPKPTR